MQLPEQNVNERAFMNNRQIMLGSILVVGLLLFASALRADRIKDLTTVEGVRANQLVGYGLVVGLDGTGDQTGQTPFTTQSLKSMLNRFGVRIPTEQNLQLKNVAAVTVHANLPPFAKPGQTIDITVSTIGNAKSLRGGSLLMTPLQGVDGQIYALAQGDLIVGGFGAATDDGNSISVNMPTVGRIPNGATVEQASPTSFGRDGVLVLNLRRGDFTTSQRIAEAINKAVGEGTARPLDATSVHVTAPEDASQRVGYLSFIENLDVEPGETSAKVIVNARTGTIIIGKHVDVSMAAVAHGNLSVTITNTPEISQPGPFSLGRTAVVPNSRIDVVEEDMRAFLFEPGVSLEEVVRAINRVGAAPSDLVAILQALKQAGALRAELIVI